MLNNPGLSKTHTKCWHSPRGPRSGPGLRAALSVLQELGRFRKRVSGHEGFWPSKRMQTSDMGLGQYLLIPFLGGWTSINPSYFDVNYRGIRVLTHCHIQLKYGLVWTTFLPIFPVLGCFPIDTPARTRSLSARNRGTHGDNQLQRRGEKRPWWMFG